MKLEVATANFTKALNAFAGRMAKNVGEAVREEARFVAERLRRLTPPSTQQQGKNRVAVDIRRVYQENEWFEHKFQFRNQKLQERVLNAIRGQDTAALEIVFNRSSRLRRLKVEGFSDQAHERGRDNRGRVRYKDPVSLPIAGQGDVNEYIKEKQKNVGLVKGAFGRMVQLLGGKSPGWLNRGSGSVRDNSANTTDPNVILINSAPTAAAVCNRLNIVERALAGRAKDLEKKIEKGIEQAKQFAAF